MKLVREKWQPVKGYKGYYEVDRKSNIRSLHKHNYQKVISQSKNSSGYYTVSLRKNDKRKTAYVHRIVAMAFLENRKRKIIVNHINCNKLDNRVANLECATNSENTIHAFMNGCIPGKQLRIAA